MKHAMVLTLSLLALGACNTVPPTNVQQPMTARPAPRTDTPAAPGSIFQAGATRTLFEDRRARYVGDTMHIIITETTSASVKSNTNASKTTAVTASVPTVSGLPGKSLQGLSLDASSSNSLTGKGDAAANNVFTGTITVTVIEVLANGNLLVSGEKQVSVGGGGTEYIRLSGVVNPYFISAANTIASTSVADARIEYKQSGVISDAQVMGWLARFFLSALPF